MEKLAYFCKKENGLCFVCGKEDFVFSPHAVRIMRHFDLLRNQVSAVGQKVLEDIIDNFKRKTKINRKILIFRSLLNSEGEYSSAISQCSWYIASELKKRKIPFVFSNVKLMPDGGDFIGKEDLKRTLDNEKDIGFVVLPLTEFYIGGARKIGAFIKKCSENVIIAAGGIMPTRYPYHVLAHFPEIGMIIRGDGEHAFADAVQILSEGDFKRLSELKGFFFRHENIFVSSFPEIINHVENLDSVYLDFNLLEKKDTEQGGFFYLTRGCRNACKFCVSFSRGNPRVISVNKTDEWFGGYRTRLEELYSGNIPENALNIGFYDDDLFADRGFGINVLKSAKKYGLKISFIQTAIKSFFKNGKIHDSFINEINKDYFSESCRTRNMHPNLFLGTENFSDEELAVLGKGYSFKEISVLVDSLSRHGITQRHHLILSNVFTRLKHIKENIAMVYSLRHKYPKHFFLLQNITPSLYSFYGTASYAMAENAGLLQNTNPHIISIEDFPEFDYPVAGGDTPADKEAAAIIPAAIEALKRI